MADQGRLLRSVLYVPADKPRALQKARELGCDGLIFDLEDAVLPEHKAVARDALAATLREGGYGDRLRLVRVNALASGWGRADLAAVAAMAPDGVVLPKITAPADVAAARQSLPDSLPLWAMIETADGVLAAAAIARAPGMAGVIFGSNDLALELGCDPGHGRAALQHALQATVLAARAAGVACLDGVFNRLDDAGGLAAECEQGRAFGFDGKTLIHPGQIAAANRAFAPSAEQIALARRQIAAWESAQAAGHSIAVLDGRMLEQLHIVAAERVLARAARLAAESEKGAEGQ